MTQAAPTTPAESADDLVCVRCGYPLRGLPPGGRCPECGSGIQQSLSASTRFLRHAPPGWLASLAAGAALMVAGLFGYVNLGSSRSRRWSTSRTGCCRPLPSPPASG